MYTYTFMHIVVVCIWRVSRSVVRKLNGKSGNNLTGTDNPIFFKLPQNMTTDVIVDFS